MHNFKELKVWQKGVDLAVKIYTVTKLFPVEEKFGLVSQMRRAGVSVPSNIAAGCAKSSPKSFANSLEVSLGERFELETQMIISEKVGILYPEIAREMESEVQPMIMGLKSSLESKS